MSVVRKVLFTKNFMQAQRFVTKSRTLHLSGAEINDKFIVRSVGEVTIPEVTIPEMMESKFLEYGNLTAVVCAETGKQYTYQQLLDKMNNLAKSLRKILKLQKGDKVAVISKNSPDYMLSIFGIMKSGLVTTSLNPLYTPEEIAKQLADSDAKVIIAQTSLFQNVKKSFEVLKRQIPIIVVKEKESDGLPENTINFDELVNNKVDFPEPELGGHDDLVFLPYSSGTTGLPKGVELSHRNIVSNVYQVQHPQFDLMEPPAGGEQNQLPLVLPMYHIYGFTCGMLFTLYRGFKLTTLPKFTPDLFINVLKTTEITHIFAAPPLILFLINNPGVKTEYFRRLKVLNNGAAPLSYMDEIKMREKVNREDVIVSQGYGLTETAPLVSAIPKSYRCTPETGGTIGQIVPNTVVKIISTSDNSGKALGPREQGELLIKGPQVMKRYYNKPEETEKTFMDGWFRTGDIGYYNEEGYFFITDRLKELIKVKGFQVPPAELEAVIRSHPEVEDVGVIGIPHASHGEVPKAFVVAKNKSKFNTDQLKDYVASKVANYKQLVGGVQIVDSIPRNPTGKILRRELKEKFVNEAV